MIERGADGAEAFNRVFHVGVDAERVALDRDAAAASGDDDAFAREEARLRGGFVYGEE